MQDSNKEIYFVILIGAVLALLLVGFIVTILFLYQRRQHRQEQEMTAMKDQYQQELLRSQLEIQEYTLKTIAQELHDNIGQVLSVVKLSLAIAPIQKDHPAFEGISGSRELLNKAIYDLSALTKSLHSDRISQVGLSESIRYELDMIRRAGLINVTFQADHVQQPGSEQTVIFMFRIFQEMINNMLKHAKATSVEVTLENPSEDIFILRVKDNGVGFDKQEKIRNADAGSGIGLKNLINRVRLIGAKIDIDSAPGAGTCITVTLPLTSENL